jgi:hypothetical protein
MARAVSASVISIGAGGSGGALVALREGLALGDGDETLEFLEL